MQITMRGRDPPGWEEPGAMTALVNLVRDRKDNPLRAAGSLLY